MITVSARGCVPPDGHVTAARRRIGCDGSWRLFCSNVGGKRSVVSSRSGRAHAQAWQEDFPARVGRRNADVRTEIPRTLIPPPLLLLGYAKHLRFCGWKHRAGWVHGDSEICGFLFCFVFFPSGRVVRYMYIYICIFCLLCC